MSKSSAPPNTTAQAPSLPYGSLTHDDIKRAFCATVNVTEPAHPYVDDPYPLTTDDLKYSYKRASSSYYASCGPRRSRHKPVLFKADKKFFNNQSPERILAILTHELTHVTVGSHSNKEHGGHPPRFWREVGFNAHLVLDAWSQLEEVFGALDKEDYIGHIVRNEVTRFNIDKRYGSVTKRRQEMARWFESTLKS